MSGRGRKRKVVANNKESSSAEKKVKKNKIYHKSHSSQSGTVLALGEGDVGQLGLGEDILERTKPAVVTIPEPVIQVCAGGMHTLCLTVSGKIYSFGCNDEGALGRKTADKEGSEMTPALVDFAAKVVQVSAGDSHTAALTDDGSVYIWGTFRDANGTMGLTPTIKTQITPVKILDGVVVVKIASGNDHLVCLTEDGELYTLGCAEQGQLGRVAECFSQRGGRKGLGFILNPGVVHCRRHRGSGKVRFTDVWTGQYMTYAKAKDTLDVYSWGLNNYYQLGFDDMQNRFVPVLAKSFDCKKDWQLIAGGQHHTVAIDAEGKTYSLGRKEYGRLGIGENCEETSSPTLVTNLQDKKCVAADCGTAMSLAMTEEGCIYSWGMGSSSQLGHSDGDDVWTAEAMQGKQLQDRKGIMISAGGQHTVLLVKDK